MGYTTYFTGHFLLDKPLEEKHAAYLHKFSETRRMKRSPALLQDVPDPLRVAVGLPLGPQGAYFVGNEEKRGGIHYTHPPSILHESRPPLGQPGLWCQWIPTEDGTGIMHYGGDKFIYYVEWLQYLIEHFLQPWGYVLSGDVHWQGDFAKDVGMIIVRKNMVTTSKQ
jgi:hypothetical protein